MKQRAYLFIAVLLTVTLFQSCDDAEDASTQKQPPAGAVIAQVDDHKLYDSELSKLDFSGLSTTDSLRKAKLFINTWVKRQLLLIEAEKDSTISTDDIELRLAELRKQFLAYEFKMNLIEARLDTVVNSEQIQEYFGNNQSDFELKNNIVRGAFIKIKNNSPGLQQLVAAFYSSKEGAMEKIQELSETHADSYFISDSTWTKFDAIVVNSPYANLPNQIQFLKSYKYSQRYDKDFVYLFRINDYKMIDDIAPIELNKQLIHNIIINKRKQQLVKEFERDLYSLAMKKRRIEIY